MNLKGFLQDKKGKKLKKDQWLILFLAGIFFLVVAMPTGKQKSEASGPGTADSEPEESTSLQKDSDYAAVLEQRLEQILAGMDGVGEVQVMITFADEGESVVEKDVTMRQEADTRNTVENSSTVGAVSNRESSETTVFTQNNGDETPFVNKEILPGINGVLVVAQGGDDSAVRKNISEAVEALFDLDVHKIKIVKMKTKGASN